MSAYDPTKVAGAGNLPYPTAGGADDNSFLNSLQQILGNLSGVGSVLGGQAGGDARAQVSQGQLDNANNANQIQLYNDAQNAQFQAGNQDLNRQQFATNNRAQTAKQALVGALLSGGYKPTVPGAAISSGLLKTLNSNPDALAAMKTLGTQGSTAQNTPLTFSGGDILAQPHLAPPTKIQNSAAGKTGGFLQLLGSIAPIVGAFL